MGDQFPGVGCKICPVVGCHTISPQGGCQALDGIPVEFESGAYNQSCVTESGAVIQHHYVVLGLKFGDSGLYPLYTLGYKRLHGAFDLFGVEYTAANHSEAWLIVVGFGRIDQGQPQVALSRQQAGGDGNSGGAGANN